MQFTTTCTHACDASIGIDAIEMSVGDTEGINARRVARLAVRLFESDSRTAGLSWFPDCSEIIADVDAEFDEEFDPIVFAKECIHDAFTQLCESE